MPIKPVLASVAAAGLAAAPAAADTVFTASLTPDQVVVPDGGADPVAGGLNASAVATLSLSDDMTELTYSIQFFGLNIVEDASARTGDDDVTAVHFHVGEPGTNGPHTLNVFGFAGPPSGTIREDDADLVVDASSNTLSGIWDNGDGMNNDMPWGSKPLSDFLTELLAGNIYIQAHTNAYPSPSGALRGAVVPAPAGAAVLALSGIAASRRKR